MTDVVDALPEPLPKEEKRRDRSADRKDRVTEDGRRDREPRERRDDRDDRPPRRDQHERRTRIEDRLGPGNAMERRDRERENKRRKSPSPPPFGHRDRDRRFSPPLRRTPPYKRSRRDEEHDAGRKGTSPRGNLLPGGEDIGRATSFAGDRRYGYDAMGPYDARGGQGGVHGGDDRSHSRHGGRSGFHGGQPEWPGPHRTGFSDGPHGYGASPARREGLMSYKQFIAELEDDILPAEAERRYDEYKAEFITTQKRAFFEQNKDEDWLREKYDPSRLEAVLLRRNENAKTLAKDFQTELQAGSLDIGASAVAGLSVAKDDQGSDDEMDTHAKRRKPSQTLPRDREFEAAPKAPAALADPKRILKDIEQARSVIKKLDEEKGIVDNILLTSGNSNADGEKVISGTSVGTIVIIRGANQVKGLEGIELMDVILTYLWRVHGLDYYGMVELKDPPKGLRHVRAVEAKGGDETAAQVAAAEWEKKLDAHWQARMAGQDLIVAMLGRDKLEATANEALDPFVRKIRDEKYGWKYGCGAKGCTKLFHGPEYVHKHLKLKHSELVSDVVAKAREDLYFQNYMSDPDAPGGNQTFAGIHGSQRDKNRRRRTVGVPGGGPPFAGAAERMATERNANAGLSLVGSSRGIREGGDRFERGGVRENERSDRVSHEEEPRFDRGGERSPSRGDFATGLGGGPPYDGGPPGPFEGGPSDTQMFDPFNGPPLRGPPFGSDIPPPPPVLMPVPGAGPLGPFVPAPPEVAMRMLREQGGPPPFLPGAFNDNYEVDGNGGGGPRGRKGRVGGTGGHGMNTGMMDNPPPMMGPLSQNIRHDPRNVRSYHDLDAPEDEVTVIDYRSL